MGKTKASWAPRSGCRRGRGGEREAGGAGIAAGREAPACWPPRDKSHGAPPSLPKPWATCCDLLPSPNPQDPHQGQLRGWGPETMHPESNEGSPESQARSAWAPHRRRGQHSTRSFSSDCPVVPREGLLCSTHFTGRQTAAQGPAVTSPTALALGSGTAAPGPPSGSAISSHSTGCSALFSSFCLCVTRYYLSRFPQSVPRHIVSTQKSTFYIKLMSWDTELHTPGDSGHLDSPTCKKNKQVLR